MFTVRHPNRPRDGRSLFALSLARWLPGLTFGDIANALSRSRRQHRRPPPSPVPAQGRA